MSIVTNVSPEHIICDSDPPDLPGIGHLAGLERQADAEGSGASLTQAVTLEEQPDVCKIVRQGLVRPPIPGNGDCQRREFHRTALPLNPQALISFAGFPNLWFLLPAESLVGLNA